MGDDVALDARIRRCHPQTEQPRHAEPPLVEAVVDGGNWDGGTPLHHALERVCAGGLDEPTGLALADGDLRALWNFFDRGDRDKVARTIVCEGCRSTRLGSNTKSYSDE
mgnify:CR=1 FL=1